jgi:hypothetical protein
MSERAQTTRLLASSLLAAGLAGCAGARTTVVAPTAAVPVSLSPAVFDEDGQNVSAERRTSVGTFRAQRTAISLVWTAAPLHAKTDLSKAINEQVGAVHGDAVVNLEITSRSCAYSVLVMPFGVLPFFPGCTVVGVTGDIVRVAPRAPRAAGP